MNMRYATAAAVLLAASPAPAARVRGQDVPKVAAGVAVLAVVGAVKTPLSLTAADLAKKPRRSVKATDHSGKEATFEGVALVDLLKEAGAPVGQELRGPSLALYLVVEASDGYRAVYALPELDPAFSDRVIILADRRDGKPLPPPEGPFRIVVPGEKKFARWVRQVTTLKVGKAD